MQNRDAVILKLDGKSQGKGVQRVDKAAFDFAVDRIPGDFVIQELIRHSRFFDTWNTSATTNLRLYTYKAAGAAAEVRGGYLRIGRALDPTTIGTRNIRVSIDARTGALASMGVLPDWRQVERHPDSEAPFAGATVPRIDVMSVTVRELHDRLPHVAVIGWDLTLDDHDRPRVLEWNGYKPGMCFVEAATGPHFPELARRDWRAVLARQRHGDEIDGSGTPARRQQAQGR